MDEAQVKQMVDGAVAAAVEAATPAIVEAAGKAVGESVGGQITQAVAEGLKPVVDRVGKLEEAGAAKAPAAGDPQVITVEEFERRMAERDAKAAKDADAAKADAAKAKARDAYVAAKMGDVPAGYHGQMPATDDEAELAKAEQAVRATFRADAKAAGMTVPDVGERPPSSGSPAAAGPDTEKMPPARKLATALKAEAAE